MKIAQVVPVHLPVPPVGYGGIERVVASLTDELVAMGHDVTVFASGDSTVRAKLEPLCRRAAIFSPEPREPEGCHLAAMEKIVRRSSEFDLWHFHFNYLHLPFLRRHPELRGLTTLHIRLDTEDVRQAIEEYRELPFVSISDAQRSAVRGVNWLGTVHNGIDVRLYRAELTPGRYLAFLGRFSREKGLHTAWQIARRAGMELVVAGSFDSEQSEYTRDVVRPILESPNVRFLGEVGDRGKQELLAGAYATLFPIEWPEPFGLVMIESLACGTPVIAPPLGAVPEVLRDGETGFLAASLEDALGALRRIPRLSRKRCREEFEKRFSSRAMGLGYARVYQRLLERPGSTNYVLVEA
jgi:glycosyltransferase involved in cell wall biosynthesis